MAKSNEKRSQLFYQLNIIHLRNIIFVMANISMFSSYRVVADTLDEVTIDNLRNIIPKVTVLCNNFLFQYLVLVIHELNVVSCIFS